MKSFSNLAENEGEILGPGTDLIISLMAILLMVIAINSKIFEEKQNRLTTINKHQMEVIKNIAAMYKKPFPDTIRSNIYGISIDEDEEYDIIIQNGATLQRVRFGDKILFPFGKYLLNSNGENVIRKVGSAFSKKLNFIEEIQIQGHTDTKGEDKYNLRLASKRAIEVFDFLKNEVEIDPAVHLMSATTFGKFKPVDRLGLQNIWNLDKINQANKTENDRRKNRRIDIVLNYRE